MPRNPCPRCTDYFMSERLLQTHIHYIHNDGASQPTRPDPLVWAPRAANLGAGVLSRSALSPSATSQRADEQRIPVGNAAGSSAQMGGQGNGDDGNLTRGQKAAPRGEAGWSMQLGLSVEKPRHKRRTDRGPLDLMQPSSSSDGSTMLALASRLPPRTTSTSSMRAPFNGYPGSGWADLLPAAIPAAQRRRSASPERLAAATTTSPVRSFIVVYESKEHGVQQRLELLTTTPWASFTALLESVSTPVAGAYIADRTTGFTLGDGSWLFALVDHEGTREDRWRVLTSNLFYQAMIRSKIWRSSSQVGFGITDDLISTNADILKDLKIQPRNENRD
ncbi:MAG: hypothetical protein M1830_000062 [Pleopsidium flavum]|nr:MAG: hypothetical protein M1830_000062 [Pleopsidium flavum]